MEIVELPLVPVRDTVLFPRMVSPLMVGRERSVRAIEEAMSRDRTIVVVAQRQQGVNDVGLADLFEVGTEAAIGRVLKMPDGTTSILVQGQRRLSVLELAQKDPFILARTSPILEPEAKDQETDALMRAVLALFEKVVKLHSSLPEDAYVAAMNVDDPGWLADLIVSTLSLPVPQKQELLETIGVLERLRKVNLILAKELEVLEMENKILQEVRQEVDKKDREYFLRQQLKEIQKELGETDPLMREISELREKVATTKMPAEAAKKAEEEMDRLSTLPTSSPEVAVIRNYLDWVVNVPWSQETEDNLDIQRAAKLLDENHYGLPKVKERILEFISARKMAATRLRGPILCFLGPPGVGKTSLGQSIALALGRKFVRISLGGIHDEAEIRGHRRTYIGALPGRIIQTVRTAGTINPVFMMDEIDKLGMDFRGDPAAALLEVLDPEQNHAFSDHYLEIPYNLSKVMFILTANILDPVPPALRDRMEVIELPGYTEEEKLGIAKYFLVPKQLKEHGLEPDRLRFGDAAIRYIIRNYTQEAGLRNLEREIGTICRKVAKTIAEGGSAPRTISTRALAKYLGPEKYLKTEAEEKDEVGVATGVYWTPTGGDLATVEVTLMEGKGELILTGSLGDVMKESAQAAMSYIRSSADKIGIKDGIFEQTDSHIHLPAGAIPKDGPSAGITMATALVSAFTKHPVRRDVAMTGEITLRGRVLPIGGLKEKVLAAHRAGIRTFILPKKNEKDLLEIPTQVKKELNFISVDHMEEVVRIALVEPDGARPKDEG